MRGVPWAVVGLLLLAGCGSGGTAAASCAAPRVAVTPGTAAPGDTVTVTGEWLHSGCNDYDGADEEETLTDVPVTFVQGDATTELARVDGEGEHHSASVDVVVPTDATPGPASITIGQDGYPGASVTVTG